MVGWHKKGIKNLKTSELKEIQRKEMLNMQAEMEKSEFFAKGPIDKYWKDEHKNLFRAKYPINFREEYLEEWDDLAYMIRRSKVNEI